MAADGTPLTLQQRYLYSNGVLGLVPYAVPYLRVVSLRVRTRLIDTYSNNPYWLQPNKSPSSSRASTDRGEFDGSDRKVMI